MYVSYATNVVLHTIDVTINLTSLTVKMMRIIKLFYNHVATNLSLIKTKYFVYFLTVNLSNNNNGSNILLHIPT